MGEPQTIRLGGAEYVIVPKADYLKMSERAGIPAGAVDAREYMRSSLSASLKKARESAKLTQEELAERLGVSQTMVSGAEGGRVKVSERYVRNVLKACGLPEDWNGQKVAKRRAVGRKRTKGA